MVRWGVLGSALIVVFAVSCGSSGSSDSSGSGGNGGATGGAAGSSGSTSTGGSAGSGGAAGSGGSTGGAAGSSGAAGTGAAGAGGTGVTFKNHGTCPGTQPTPGSNCSGAGFCCYEADGPVFKCELGLATDGGSQSRWKPMPNTTCCPATPPATGTACTTPIVITCCYGSTGFQCGTQQNPGLWTTATGC